MQPVQLLQISLDLTHRHSARVHSDDVVVEARQTALIFGDQLRLEGGLPVASNIQFQLAARRDDGLGAGAVPMVA
ncbi:hypothetical protein CV_2315 [Chromobacterium violaceum ATCC 12472]|uniref:Uncharacterized protein n=1 Tax=Chromobacterium violaceum (strain ATCC 12472 / DSM 30191 / JCM 1249 / CCUG 213 / NBRC 12614 / NCIMB 9131 / NCTC 9757 / MK) TaxID=243365 RepID=Q7NVM7_CHRVO|nr:hypothetical protein CV_2315 [Chromobacterium violaceum ATCC 12472]